MSDSINFNKYDNIRELRKSQFSLKKRKKTNYELPALFKNSKLWSIGTEGKGSSDNLVNNENENTERYIVY